MIRTHYIRAMEENNKNTVKLDMDELKRGRKPEKVVQAPSMSQTEKEARIYALAMKLGVKIGGAK